MWCFHERGEGRKGPLMKFERFSERNKVYLYKCGTRTKCYRSAMGHHDEIDLNFDAGSGEVLHALATYVYEGLSKASQPLPLRVTVICKLLPLPGTRSLLFLIVHQLDIVLGYNILILL